MTAIRFHTVLFLFPLLAACATTAPASGPAPAPLLGQTVWVNPAAASDFLRLDRDGSFGRYRKTTPSPNTTTDAGHWDTVSAEQQVIVLDGRTPIHLVYRPNAALPYLFVPFEFTARGLIPPDHFDDYLQLSGQWYAPKSLFEPAAGDQSLTSFFSPSRR